MKNSTKTRVTLKAVDTELKKLISQDLAQFKAAKLTNKQVLTQQAA